VSFAKYLHANEDNGRPAVSSWQRDLLLAVVDWHFNRINCSVNESRAPYCFRWLSLDLMAQLSVGQNRSLTRPSFWGLKACSEPAATATKKKKNVAMWSAAIFQHWNSANWHSIYAGYLILFMWQQLQLHLDMGRGIQPSSQDISQRGMSNNGKDICPA